MWGFENHIKVSDAYSCNIKLSAFRPGEKLFKEKPMTEEGLRRTDNKFIHIGNSIHFKVDAFFERVESLTSRMDEEAAVMEESATG